MTTADIEMLALGIPGLLISAATLCYLIRYARDTKRLADDTQKLAKTSLQQLALSERPFIAWNGHYDEHFGIVLVYAHNQGVGPALDVEAVLRYDDEDEDKEALNYYGIGCLAAGGMFQFKIGERSQALVRAEFRYKSISGRPWRVEVFLTGGLSYQTEVFDQAAS